MKMVSKDELFEKAEEIFEESEIECAENCENCPFPECILDIEWSKAMMKAENILLKTRKENK